MSTPLTEGERPMFTHSKKPSLAVIITSLGVSSAKPLLIKIRLESLKT
jgi:hypothetical protein